jgi:predicted O-methyltransferase YrrM
MARLERIKQLWDLGGASLIAGRALRFASDELVALSAPRAFRRTVGDPDVERALDIALHAKFQHYEAEVQAVQVREEIAALLDELRLRRPRSIVEIGTAKGGTLFLFTRVAADDATLISIDLPGTGYGPGYPRRYRRLYRSFARAGQVIHLIQADSHERSTVKTVRSLARSSIDFLFIDGDHSHDGVRRDYEYYSPLVKRGGVIALHDIVPGDEALVGGVPSFWKDLKLVHASTAEYVRDWNQGGYGIGVVRLPIERRRNPELRGSPTDEATEAPAEPRMEE